MKNIIFNKTEIFVGRNTSDHACQIFCSKSYCETMYHWFFLFEITMVKIMNNLNVCSAHSYLYHRSRFKDVQCRHVLLYVNCYCNYINEGKWKWAVIYMCVTQASTLTYFSTCPFGQLTKKITCPTQSFSCLKKLIKITKTRE